MNRTTLRRVTPTVVLVSALLLAACSGDDAATPDGDDSTSSLQTSTSTAAATTVAVPSTRAASSDVASPGCLSPDDVGGGSDGATSEAQTLRLEHDGMERTYELSLPPDYDGTTPAPLVLNFHGFGGNGAQQNGVTSMPALAGERGYVVVAPDGGPLNIVAGSEGAEQAESQGFDGLPFWNIFGSDEVSFAADSGGIDADAGAIGADDIGFTSALIDALEAELCIDTARVYATGHSNGAGMSSALGCEIGSRFAAIGPVSGVNLTGACPGDGPVPILAIHGDADEAASYEGNYLLGFELGNPSVPDRMAQWAADNGCTAEPDVDESMSGVVRSVWTDCAADTELWTVTGGPHSWPNGERDEPTTPIDATAVVLDFFDAHVRADSSG